MLKVIHGVFNDLTLRKVLLKLRYALFAVFFIVLARYADPAWLLFAFVVSLIGELIQLWSFAALVKNEQLTARGPYVLVRNPMYLGRFFLILGLVLLFNRLAITLVYSVLYWFYMFNRVRREEVVLAQLLGEPYRQYCQHTNRFFPTLTRLTDPAVWFFRWHVLRHNNGQWNLLGMLLVYGTLFLYFFYAS